MTKNILFCSILMAILSSCGPGKKSSGSGNTKNRPATYSNTFSKSQSTSLDDQTYQLDSISVDDTYGYSSSNPIHVGGNFLEGARNQRRFLNALLGPDNQLVTYHRRGSCCGFISKNGMDGFGLLDVYEVSYEGLSKPIVLYLNLYDYGILRAPKGFTYKK